MEYAGKFHICGSVALVIPESTVREDYQRHLLLTLLRIVEVNRDLSARSVVLEFLYPVLIDDDGFTCCHIIRSRKRPSLIILEKESAANRIIVFPAANRKITEEQVSAALDKCPDAVFLQFEINSEMTLYTALKAAERGIPVFMDAGPADPSFPYESLRNVTLFSPNETECEILTGISPDDTASCIKAAEKLKAMTNAEIIVIKLGGRGCFVYADGSAQEIPSYPIEKVDTTAAGDAFTAGLTLEYLRSKDIFRAARYANAVGALTVSRLGASSSLPTSEEVEAFISERGINING